MITFILAACLVGCCLAATTMPPTPHGHHMHGTGQTHGHGVFTHGPHPTHPPHIGHSFQFHYDDTTMMMAVHVGHNCYLYDTTTDEQTAVKSDHGLYTLEKKLIDMVDMAAPSTAVDHGDLMKQSPELLRFCRHSPVKKFD